MTQPEETREEKRERLWRAYVTVPHGTAAEDLLSIVEDAERAAAEEARASERERISAWLERVAQRYHDGLARVALLSAASSLREGAPRELKLENAAPPSLEPRPSGEPYPFTALHGPEREKR